MLKIEKAIEGDTMKAVMRGRLDTNTAPVFQEEVWPLPDAVSNLTLDFGEVDYISSAGLRVLLMMEQEMEESGGKLVLRNVTDIIRDVFDVTGFLDILTIV